MTVPSPDRYCDMGDSVPSQAEPLGRHHNWFPPRLQRRSDEPRSSEQRKGGSDASDEPLSNDGLLGLKTALYVLSLTIIAVCMAALAFVLSPGPPPALVLAFLIITSILAEKQSVRLAPSIEISVAFFPVLLTAVLFGGFWAGIVGAAGLSLNVGRPYLRWTSWLASRVIAATVAGDIAQLSRSTTSHSLAALTVSAVVAMIVWTLLDTVIAATTLAVRKTAKLPELIRMTILVDVVSVLLYSPIIAVLAYTYLAAPRWTVVLFAAPAFVAQRLFVLYRGQRETAGRLSEAIATLERVNFSFATALVTALDARDHYTAGHSAAVAVYARDIAREAGLSEQEQRRAHLCGLLHDIGKIGVPTGVLEKRGPLKKSERLAIETHADVGASILERIEGYEDIALAVRHHHERFDGLGYPDRLSGAETSVMARIVAVADAYSAMTSARPYRVALTNEEAQRRIEREAGKQFDPDIVRAFTATKTKAGDGYMSGADTNFEIEIAQLAVSEPESLVAVSR
jgi:putative nucleotidyltransferase with HDIG domain